MNCQELTKVLVSLVEYYNHFRNGLNHAKKITV